MKIIRRWPAFALCAAALAMLGARAAAPQTQRHNAPRLGTLVGAVVGADGVPVSGARVTVEQSDARHAHAKLTDSHGHFEFPDLLPGMYDARAHGKNVWSAWERHIIVRAGKHTDVNLRLLKASNPPSTKSDAQPKP